MARISNEQILEIRNSVNIVDIISEYIPLVQKGKNFFGICPFHDDHNPSMSVSPEKQIYTCFVCGATGNVFSFIMDYEKVSFLEAVKKVADKLNIDLKIDNFQKPVSQYDNYYDVLNMTNKFYQNNLQTKNGISAKKYLQDRDINEEIIKEFGIGLSLSGNSAYKFLVENKFKVKDLVELGICNQGDNDYHDVFNNRITFPLYDPFGKVVGFSGRIYKGEDTSKYINSKESPIFHKGLVLYNYHRVKEDVQKEGSLIVVEGFMDVIALSKDGIKNVVATMGTAITKEQAKLIKKASPNIYLMFDGDVAGEKATLNCSEELMKIGLIPKIILLEEKLDPDDYLKKYGVEKLKDKIKNALSFLDYKMIIMKKDYNFQNSNDISEYINKVIVELDKIDDKIVTDYTINKLSDDTKVSKEIIKDLIKKRNKPLIIIKEKEQIISKYQKAYETLLYYMLKYVEVIRAFDENNVFIPAPNYRYLACEILSFYNKYKTIDIADLIAYLEDKSELVSALGKINNLDLPETYIKEEIDDYIKLLNEYPVEIMEKKKLEKAYQDALTDEEKIKIANQLLELKKGVNIDD